MKIGVLALQGAFVEHVAVINRLGENGVEIRLPAELDSVDGLIIPGGESTTITNLMRCFNLLEPLRERIQAGLPVLGTCAGMICLAKRVFNSQEAHMETLGLMDIEVKRNAFGRQVDSFEADLPMRVLGNKPFHAVFIRAPLIKSVGSGVEVMVKLPDGTIVASRQNNMLVTSFHPELTDDLRLHQYFLKMVVSGKKI